MLIIRPQYSSLDSIDYIYTSIYISTQFGTYLHLGIYLGNSLVLGGRIGEDLAIPPVTASTVTSRSSHLFAAAFTVPSM